MPRAQSAMSAAATVRPSSQASWSPNQAPSVQCTSPAGTRPKTSERHSHALSPHAGSPLKASSPNYFDYTANTTTTDSDVGYLGHKTIHASPAANDRSNRGTLPENQKNALQGNKALSSFEGKIESNTFNLSHGSLRHFSAGSGVTSPSRAAHLAEMSRRESDSPVSPHTFDHPGASSSEREGNESINAPNQVPPQPLGSPSFFGSVRRESPVNDSNIDLLNPRRNELSHINDRDPRSSLPHNRAEHLPLSTRSETLPLELKSEGPTMISPNKMVQVLRDHLPEDLLILDVRVFPQYAKSRIGGALNLCIPTTLLKRAGYDVKKLSATFKNKRDEQAKFDKWNKTVAIIVYDAASSQLQDATSCVNVLKKFTGQGWNGATLILRGGFKLFAHEYPDQIDADPAHEEDGNSMNGLTIEPPRSTPVAGGCAMPVDQGAANPFFGTIRQNMDLIGGVGQMPVNAPAGLDEPKKSRLPFWLQQASRLEDRGKRVAEHFLAIEQAEKKRMTKALSVKVSYGSPNPLSPNNFQVAGIEKGLKNRYKDILPYDHSRVRLQSVPMGDCDYVNASHVQAQGTNKRYIAAQAPVPHTFEDFWRITWEQDARVIVMLSAEKEGGNIKAHPYWLPGRYGPFVLKSLSERKASLERNGAATASRAFTNPVKPNTQKDQRPSMSRRHSSKPSISSSGPKASFPGFPDTSPSHVPDESSPHVVVRKLSLTNTNKPSELSREIIQLHYPGWPDFGAPANPAHVLGLVEQASDASHNYEHRSKAQGLDQPSQQDERPIVVHCSAGCGRTGTFCTIDSVIDMLKRQRLYRLEHPEPVPKPHNFIRQHAHEDEGVHDPMDLDTDQDMDNGTNPRSKTDAWLQADDIDLISQTVADFRLQRLSMVQTLRQFVLCYESVLEWMTTELDNDKGWA